MSEARELSRCLSLHLGCVRIHKMHFPFMSHWCSSLSWFSRDCEIASLSLKIFNTLLVLEPIWKRIYKPLAKPEHGTFDIPLYSSEWFMHVSFPCYSGRLSLSFKSINLNTSRRQGKKPLLLDSFTLQGFHFCLNFGLFFLFHALWSSNSISNTEFYSYGALCKESWDAEWNYYYFEVKKSDFFELMLFNNHTWIILLVLYLELEK